MMKLKSYWRLKMIDKRKITIGNQDIEFSGLIFSQSFAILCVITIIIVLISGIKYLFI